MGGAQGGCPPPSKKSENFEKIWPYQVESLICACFKQKIKNRKKNRFSRGVFPQGEHSGGCSPPGGSTWMGVAPWGHRGGCSPPKKVKKALIGL